MENIECYFCGDKFEKKDIIFGRKKNQCMCYKCVDLFHMIKEDKLHKTNIPHKTIEFVPSTLKKQLDDYVVGQEYAKKVISVAIYNHYKRVFKLSDKEIEKSNICLIGNSGSGKSHLIKTVAKILDIPMVIADATSFTSAGYVGRNVEDMLESLIQNADNDIEKAQYGICFIDEIDKIATKENNGKDVGGEGVQQALLKMIEGSTVTITNKYDDTTKEIDTTNILFIVSGAFSGIEKYMKNKNDKKGIGFGSDIVKSKDEDNVIQKVTQEDLINYGMIPEFVGRLQTITRLEKLKESDMVKILTEPKNAITKQYKELLSADGIELQFEEDAIKKIANIAIKHKTGARCLKTILEETMLDIMYLAPSKKTKKYVIKEKDIITTV